MGEDTGV